MSDPGRPNSPLHTPTTPSPIDQFDPSDPGDRTQANFNYQYAYGMILLCGSIKGNLPYTTLWCEHHEDFLGQRHDGHFDAYQIKTRSPQLGPWKNSEDAFKHSIERFVQLDQKFPGWINSFFFVSNTPCVNSQAKEKISTSPVQLLRAVQVNPDLTQLHVSPELHAELTKAFNKLVKACNCTPEALLKVLKRTRTLDGPSEKELWLVLSHGYLEKLPECQGLPADNLNQIRDDIISRIHQASSLYVDDPSMHYFAITGDFRREPRLLAKQIQVEDFRIWIQSKPSIPFELSSDQSPMELGSFQTKSPVMEQKLAQGGVGGYVHTMHTRALAAERKLMEMAIKSPTKIDSMITHLTEMVDGVVQKAKLSAIIDSAGQPYGPRMLRETLITLEAEANNRPDLYYRLHPEHLIGITGMLTADCKIWWSDPFPLKAVP